MNAVATVSPARSGAGSPLATFTALLRREFWEHRGGLWSAQVWTTGIFLVLIVLLLLIGEAFRLKFFGNADMRWIAMINAEQLSAAGMIEFRRAMEIGLWGLSVFNLIVLYFVVLFYCIGTLYDERKDRSILFWKSLPATDTQTVMAKLVTALLVGPLLALVFVFALHLGTLLLVGLYAALHGVNPLPFLWQPAIFGRVWGQMLATIPVHALWALPGIAWLLLASSWAKRAPFVWAILLPVLAGVFYLMVEAALRLRVPSIWIWEHVVARIFAAPANPVLRPWQWRGDNPFAHAAGQEQLMATLSATSTWVGVGIGVLLLGAAIWLRRYRDDS